MSLLGGALAPTGRQKVLAARKRNVRLGILAAVLVLLLWFVSLFFVDLEGAEVDKRSAALSRHRSEVAAKPMAPQAGGPPRTGFSMVPRRPEAASVPQKLRIFIYPDVVPASLNRNLRGKEMCWHGYLGNEVLLPELIASTTVFTQHGELADFYLVPIASECFILSEMKRGMDYKKAHQAFNTNFEHTMDALQSRYPYWAASEGRDHLFIFPSERGAATLSHDNALRIKKSIFLTGLQQRDPDWTHFNTWKDVVLPPAMSIHHKGLDAAGGDGDRPPRANLLYFRGVLPGLEDQGTWGLRSNLASALKSEPGVVFRDADADCDRQCSLAEMADSTFCLVPEGGVEGWSLRLFDSILQGCIPVIIADKWELPYQQSIDWSKISVKVLEKNAEEVVEIVKGISKASIEGKVAQMAKVGVQFRWHGEWQAGDAFDTLLDILELRVRFMRNSPYRFWTEASKFG